MITARIEFKPNDLWIGAFTKRQKICGAQLDDRPLYCVKAEGHSPQHGFEHEVFGRPKQQADLWFCIVPTLPIHVTVRL